MVVTIYNFVVIFMYTFIVTFYESFVESAYVLREIVDFKLIKYMFCSV